MGCTDKRLVEHAALNPPPPLISLLRCLTSLTGVNEHQAHTPNTPTQTIKKQTVILYLVDKEQ